MLFIHHTNYYGHQGGGVYTIILLIHLWSQLRLMAIITSQLILAFYDMAIYIMIHVFIVDIISLKYVSKWENVWNSFLWTYIFQINNFHEL